MKITKTKVKGWAVLFSIALVAGLAAIFLNNNVPEVERITSRKGGFSLLNPTTWL